MPVKTVQLNKFADVLREYPNLHIKQVKQGVASGLARSIPDLVAASPVDTGLYASSWDFTINEQEAILGNYAPHAAIIEEGARPFSPPIAPLLAWAKRVLGDGSQPPNYSEEVRSLAYGTQKKIAQEGMKPRKILENMLPTILDNIRQELEKVE